MLVLPIKKKWFDMIVSGEKKEEYREIKPYYTVRFRNAMYGVGRVRASDPEYLGWNWIILRNGYNRNAPFVYAKVKIRIGKGKPEWGAEPDTDYYVLEILDLMSKDLKSIPNGVSKKDSGKKSIRNQTGS